MIFLSYLVLGLCLIYLLALWSFKNGFLKLASAIGAPVFGSSSDVSVLIAMRNEEHSIAKCLESIVNSKVSANVEILVVDDNSSDRSKEEVLNFASRLKQKTVAIKLLDSKGSGKKAALVTAMEEANYPLIYTTDADCVLGTYSLQAMINDIENGVDMMVGPVVYPDSDSVFVNMQNLDLLGLIAVGAGSLFHGLASMCNGANLAFRQSAFHEVEGYKGNEKISSGDDLFLMHKLHHRNPKSVRFCTDPRALVTTEAETSLDGFFHQRRRWASKGRRYTDIRMRLLSILVFAVNLGLIVMGISLFWSPVLFAQVLISFLIKILADFLLLRASCKHFKKSHLLKYFLFEQVLHIPYVVLVGLSSQFGRIIWKDREISR